VAVLGLTKKTKKRFAKSWRPVSSRIQASISPKTVRFVGSLRTFCTAASTARVRGPQRDALPPDIEVLDGYSPLDERVLSQ